MVGAARRASFGTLVRAKREQLRLTQAELARRVGVSRSEISELEAGRIRHPRADVFGRICKALGVSGAAVLGADIAFAEGLAEIDAEELFFLATSLVQLAERDRGWLRDRLTELRDLLLVRHREAGRTGRRVSARVGRGGGARGSVSGC